MFTSLVVACLAAPAQAAAPTLAYEGIQCVTAQETHAIVCSRANHRGLTVSVSRDHISVWRNGGDYRTIFSRRNR